jgi:hypothetical protein
MPITFNVQQEGPYSLSLHPAVALVSDAQRTGGSDGTDQAVAVGQANEENLDIYSYRNSSTKLRFDFVPEVRDSQGRIKWAPDD